MVKNYLKSIVNPRAYLLYTNLVLFLSYSTGLVARDSIEMSFENLPLLSQLPSSSVQRVYQDKEGYIWFGTLDGLCRYDAYNIKSWRSDMNNPSLLTHNEILSITEDDDNKLWIGTKQGLNILDKTTLEIVPFHESTIQNQQIKSLEYDSDGYLWIGGQNGVCKYHTKDKSFKTYVADEFDKKTIPSYGVTSLYKDNKGDIWITFWGAGLCRYDKATDSFQRFPPVGEQNIPFRLFQDNKGRYWVCTWGDGFFRFDPEAEEDLMYTHYPIKKSGSNGYEQVFFSITQDEKYGYLWAISLSGLSVFDYKEDSGELECIDITSHLRKTSKLFSEIVKDKNKNLWIGAFSEGVFSITFDKPAVRNFSLDILEQKLGSPSCISAMTADMDGLLWLGLNRIGVCLYDIKKGTAILHSEIPAMRILDQETVNYIQYIKSLKECWITTSGSMVYAFRKTGATLSSYSFDLNINERLNTSENKVIFEDRQGRVWIGMQRGLVVKPLNGAIEYVLDIPSVTGITQEKDGTIWISSENAGLYELKEEEGTYKAVIYDKYTEGLNTNNVQAICTHTEGLLWIGTKEGRIIAYDKRKKEFIDYSSVCAMTGEGILSIIDDEAGNLWIATKKRITQFNPASGFTTYFSVFEDLAVSSFVGRGIRNSSGEIIFGGNKGFCLFSTEKRSPVNKEVVPQKVFITEIRIDNHSVYEKGSGGSFNHTSNKLVIGHSRKNIEIVFSTLNYSYPTKVQYAYMLDGVDKDWIYLGNDRRQINYNNLQKGKYTLLLKATDENGIWTDEATSLEIIKQPAFYETWWAYLSYIFLGLLILAIALYISINRIRLTNRLRIIEIEKEKSEELTQVKLRYFTNISHELLTPLTIVSCLIEDVESSYKGKFWQHEVMRSNISRLKRLLQQILDFRKVESGNLKLGVSLGDLVSFIKHICRFNFTPLEKEKGISLGFTPPCNHLPAWFDHDKMDKIIFNLLSNAFKYTGKGGEIRIDLEEVTKDENCFARIIISDTGKGIAADELDRIFERFYSNAPSHTIENHGIGLALTKELIELHHGWIEVKSELGMGTTFFFEIPIDKGAYADKEITKDLPSELSDNAKDLSEQDHQASNELILPDSFTMDSTDDATEDSPEKEDVTILVVEDNSQLRMLISKILAKKYIILEAENGIEALKKLSIEAIDIIISDVMMPEMDGLALCRKIKEDISTNHIEVLLLTARNSIDDRIECYDAGADGYISKPFELRVLDAKINSLVRNRKKRSTEFKSSPEINISSLKYTSIDEQFLNDAIKVIENHLQETNFDMETFASALNMSKSSLYRKLKALTSLSPVEFIRDIRLKHACQMLKKQKGNISDIAYSTGFTDPKYFSSCFKIQYGITPSEFIRMHKEE